MLLKKCFISLGPFLSLILVGCGQENIGISNQAAEIVSKKAESLEIMTLKGRLDYRPMEWKKTFNSWNGIEFFLTNSSGQSYHLSPSKEISGDSLIKYDGVEVVIKGYWYIPPDPEPNTPYPMDEHGNPRKRTKRFMVTHIEKLT